MFYWRKCLIVELFLVYVYAKRLFIFVINKKTYVNSPPPQNQQEKKTIINILCNYKIFGTVVVVIVW
jgi:hypothetical protein